MWSLMWYWFNSLSACSLHLRFSVVNLVTPFILFPFLFYHFQQYRYYSFPGKNVSGKPVSPASYYYYCPLVTIRQPYQKTQSASPLNVTDHPTENALYVLVVLWLGLIEQNRTAGTKYKVSSTILSLWDWLIFNFPFRQIGQRKSRPTSGTGTDEQLCKCPVLTFTMEFTGYAFFIFYSVAYPFLLIYSLFTIPTG